MKALVFLALNLGMAQAHAITYKCDKGVTLNLGANLAEVSFKNEKTLATGKIVDNSNNQLTYALNTWVSPEGYQMDSTDMSVSQELIKGNKGAVTVIASFEGSYFAYEYSCKLVK